MFIQYFMRLRGMRFSKSAASHIIKVFTLGKRSGSHKDVTSGISTTDLLLALSIQHNLPRESIIAACICTKYTLGMMKNTACGYVVEKNDESKILINMSFESLSRSMTPHICHEDSFIKSLVKLNDSGMIKYTPKSDTLSITSRCIKNFKDAHEPIIVHIDGYNKDNFSF